MNKKQAALVSQQAYAACVMSLHERMMRMLQYTMRNIRLFRQKDRQLYLLICLCAILSALVIFFSSGLTIHFQKLREYGDSDSYTLDLQYRNLVDAQKSGDPDYTYHALEYPDYLTVGDVRRLLRSMDSTVFLNQTGISSDCIYRHHTDAIQTVMHRDGAMSVTGIQYIFLRFQYDRRTDLYTMRSDELRNAEGYGKKSTLLSGRYLNNHDFLEGKPNAVLGIGLYNDLFTDKHWSGELGYQTSLSENGFYDTERTVELAGTEFHLAGITGNDDALEISVPFSALPDETVLCSFSPYAICFQYDTPVSRLQYDYLQKAVDQSGMDQLMVKPVDFSQRYRVLYTTMLAAVIGISLISAINIAMILHYILMKRRRQIAVFKLCGCGNNKLVRCFLAEAMLIVLPAFVFGAVLYLLFMNRPLEKIFIYLHAAYTPLRVFILLLVYLLVITAVLAVEIIRTVRRSPVIIWKEG